MEAPPIESNPPRKIQGQERSNPVIIQGQFPFQQQAAVQVQIGFFGQTPGDAEPDRNALT